VATTQIVDMLMRMVETLMMMVEMSMRRRNVVGWFEGMCMDWLYP
jgi:hypothetical protein